MNTGRYNRWEDGCRLVGVAGAVYGSVSPMRASHQLHHDKEDICTHYGSDLIEGTEGAVAAFEWFFG